MFVEKRIALALARERLLGRIEGERAQIAAGAAVLHKPLALADRVVVGALYVKAHPWVAAVAAAVTVVAGRRHLLQWGMRAWTVWRTWGRVRAWLRAEGYLQA